MRRISGFGFVFFPLCLLLMAGCLTKRSLRGMGNPKWGLEVTWYGHSCFSLRDSLGRVVVIDPYDETVGYDSLSVRADALLVTHRHFDHNYTRGVRTKRKNIDLVESSGPVTVAGNLQIFGISSDHDAEGGEIHGKNLIYKFRMGGLRVVHLGDLGQTKFTPHQIGAVGTVDILFIPVGGFTTLGPKEAKKLVDKINPAVVFPMHYGNIRIHKFAEVIEFTGLFPKNQVQNLTASHTRVKLEDLQEKTQVITLSPLSKSSGIGVPPPRSGGGSPQRPPEDGSAVAEIRPLADQVGDK